MLLNVNQLYLKGGEEVDRSLTMLEKEWRHIESAQTWSILEDNSVSAAEACINFAVVGAQILSVRQHPDDRVRWIDAALKCAQRFHVATREAILWNSLGVAHADLNQATRAIECHERALTLARASGDLRCQSTALGNLGVAYSDIGQTRRAIEYYEQDLTILQTLGTRREESVTLGNLGLAYAALGEITRAISYHKKHLHIAHDAG